MESKRGQQGGRVVLVAAMTSSRIIGRDGGMPWHLPADLEHFKAVTMGHPVIMGRRTFESIGRALPGRLNVVVSRGRPDLPEGVVLAASLDQALATVSDAAEVMIIGGGEIYRQALGLAERLELTLIGADIEGDTRFPAFALAEWRLVRMTARPADAANAHPLRFVSLERIRS
ncbi:dihydrofolate reductase [Wenzhouxiangella marina]|uniref:Dihydrofolate reductase n=1 Tax=Wenzhouxiangella marina TaxID=1579979 RepID=A0A0K0XSU3_9GAMM|nr:dihydrofolate reductase [Wenzhouxiangella marina]AKS40725.1 diacylglycerol kinase [Wenzhouxiangella marina]MBB6087598.1 dihydrofolate reductase [Wenzhouxiangella marina]